VRTHTRDARSSPARRARRLGRLQTLYDPRDPSASGRAGCPALRDPARRPHGQSAPMKGTGDHRHATSPRAPIAGSDRVGHRVTGSRCTRT
jgi:hypothetical protein